MELRHKNCKSSGLEMMKRTFGANAIKEIWFKKDEIKIKFIYGALFQIRLNNLYIVMC